MALRVAIRGRNLADLRRYLAAYPVDIVDTSPDLVICYGGDGSLLGAERDYPGVVKFPLRDSRSNPKCPEHSEEKLLARLFSQDLPRVELLKIEAVVPGKGRLIALNDIVLNKRIISSAVRFRIWLNSELYINQVVGDGLVGATPFGSTGYYRSITRSMFRAGIGLAFNNSTEPTDHLVVPEDARVQVEVIRGPAVLLADNAPQRIRLRRGDRIEIHRHSVNAAVLGLDTFRCRQCALLRQNNRNPV